MTSPKMFNLQPSNFTLSLINFILAKSFYLEVLSTDSLADLQTGLWFAVFINLCILPSVFIRCMAVTFSFLCFLSFFLIAYLHTMDLTLGAHLIQHLLKWDSVVWLDWFVVRTGWLSRWSMGRSIGFLWNCLPFSSRMIQTEKVHSGSGGKS